MQPTWYIEVENGCARGWMGHEATQRRMARTHQLTTALGWYRGYLRSILFDGSSILGCTKQMGALLRSPLLQHISRRSTGAKQEGKGSVLV